MIRKLLVLAVFACASPALADPPGGKKGHKPDKGPAHAERSEVTVGAYFSSSALDAITGYYGGSYGRMPGAAGCPPGLAKKGCLPPGQAKKLYSIGHALPDDLAYYPLPRDLLGRLPPAPIGYSYVRVDRDVLLIGEASKKVIDAVVLLSAL